MEVLHLSPGPYAFFAHSRIFREFDFMPCTVFEKEVFLLAGVLFYVAFYFIGKNSNVNRAYKW